MIHLERGRIYRRKEDNTPYLERNGYLWMYDGEHKTTIEHRFKSVATGRYFFCVTPYVWFDEVER